MGVWVPQLPHGSGVPRAPGVQKRSVHSPVQTHFALHVWVWLSLTGHVRVISGAHSPWAVHVPWLMIAVPSALHTRACVPQLPQGTESAGALGVQTCGTH